MRATWHTVLSIGTLILMMSTANAEQSLEDIHAAAKQGDAHAQFQRGLMFFEGTEVPQDYDKATKWFKKAANKGHADAQYYRGLMLRDGLGVDQDDQRAKKWFTAAAQQDHAGARHALNPEQQVTVDTAIPKKSPVHQTKAATPKPAEPLAVVSPERISTNLPKFSDVNSFGFKDLSPGTDLTPYIDAGLLECYRAFDGARSSVCGTTDKLAQSNFKSLVGKEVVWLLIQALDNKAVRIVVTPGSYRTDPERISNTILALSDKYGDPTVLERGTYTSSSYATSFYQMSDENRTRIFPRLWRNERQTMVYGEAMPSRRDIYRATEWQSFTYFAHDDAYPGELGYDDIATQTSRICLIITDDQLYRDATSIHYNELLERQRRIEKRREEAAANDI